MVSNDCDLQIDTAQPCRKTGTQAINETFLFNKSSNHYDLELRGNWARFKWKCLKINAYSMNPDFLARASHQLSVCTWRGLQPKMRRLRQTIVRTATTKPDRFAATSKHRTRKTMLLGEYRETPSSPNTRNLACQNEHESSLDAIGEFASAMHFRRDPDVYSVHSPFEGSRTMPPT